MCKIIRNDLSEPDPTAAYKTVGDSSNENGQLKRLKITIFAGFEATRPAGLALSRYRA